MRERSLVEAVTDLIVAIVAGDALDRTVSSERYLAALRHLDLGEVRRDLDALIGGRSMQRARKPFPR